MVISSLEQVGERLDTLEKGVSKGGALPQGDLQVIRMWYACKVRGGGGDSATEAVLRIRNHMILGLLIRIRIRIH